MKEKMQPPEKASRRSFFLKGLFTGVAILFGSGSAKASCTQEEMITMITADGRLVEVPKKILPSSSNQRISNRKLLEWKEKEAKGICKLKNLLR